MTHSGSDSDIIKVKGRELGSVMKAFSRYRLQSNDP